MQGQHRLAAIMFTDIVGYTATMQHDEPLALTRVARHKKVLETMVPRHGGEVLNYYGDGSLSIFPSAIEAVQCGMDIQTSLHTLDDLPLRIGIHLGEIIFENGQYLGDGINIASRIQSEGKAGSICFSETIRDLVRNNFGPRINFMGVRQLKNVENAMPLYCIDPFQKRAVPQTASLKGWSKLKLAYLGILVLVIAAFAIQPWKFLTQKDMITERPSIMILPFKNLNPENNEDYLGEGIADEVRSQLSFIQGLEVKSRATSQHYGEQHLPASDIAGQLDIQYLLEGSIRRSGGRFKLDLSLSDVRNDKVITPIKYENRDEKDLTKLQNEIAQIVVAKIKPSLSPQEDQRLNTLPTTSFAAYQNYLMGKYFTIKSSSREDLDQAMDYFRNALKEDPNYAQAYAGLSEVICMYAGWALMPVQQIIDEADELAQTAITLDPYLAEAQLAKGIVQAYKKEFSAAESSMLKAVEYNPYLDLAHFNLAHVELMLGKYDLAIESSDKAKQLNPFSPLLFMSKARVLRDANHYSEALSEFEASLKRYPGDNTILWQYAVYYVVLGDYQKAISVLEERTVGKTNWIYGYCYGQLGQEAKAREILDIHLKLAQKQYISPAFIASIYWSLGEKTKAAEWIKKEEMYYFSLFPFIREIEAFAKSDT
ncbi:MAG: tetratricopeptide repeat protein [Saprospiraceae bacterium]|nr:tetratricopeptide repeat protein [Saprospiraceae bacterium]HPG06309.1 tetratricopeptide repeat protein [Saprospiraceae bacterium]